MSLLAGQVKVPDCLVGVNDDAAEGTVEGHRVGDETGVCEGKNVDLAVGKVESEADGNTDG